MKKLIALLIIVAMTAAMTVPVAADYPYEEKYNPDWKVNPDWMYYIEEYYESDGSFQIDVTEVIVYIDITDTDDLDFDVLFDGAEYGQIIAVLKETVTIEGTEVKTVLVGLYDHPENVDWFDEDACKARIYKAFDDFSKLEHVFRIGLNFIMQFSHYTPIVLAEEDKKFDVNGDNKINARDVRNLMKAIISPEKGYDTAFDVNSDGKVNARDVKILMQKIVGCSTVTCDSPSALCLTSGHVLTATYVTETVHNVYEDSPHCVCNKYLVISCERAGCDYIEKILECSARVASCHG